MIENTDNPLHNITRIWRNITKDKQGTFYWIIDTKATYHVTYEKKILCYFSQDQTHIC